MKVPVRSILLTRPCAGSVCVLCERYSMSPESSDGTYMYESVEAHWRLYASNPAQFISFYSIFFHPIASAIPCDSIKTYHKNKLLGKPSSTKTDTTGSEINHSFLFHGVLKNLTACGMLRISIARCQIEAEIHSFPTMYIMGGGRYVRNGSNQ